jgi:peroxiredoxin Q/BCP
MIDLGFSFPVAVLLTTAGELSVSSFKGRNIVIYFYPKDDTPGCTVEANDFSNLFNKFEMANTVVFGVSRDSLESHQKFCDKYKIPFPLVIDNDKQLCNAFNVLQEKTIFGKKLFDLIDRSTFVFDKEHQLVREWRNVKASGHAAEVLAYIEHHNNL